MKEQIWHLGEIQFFDSDKGFGFVKSLDNQQEYFIHISKIATFPIEKNDKVVFQLEKSRRNKGAFEAIYLRLLSKFKFDNDFLIQQFIEISQIDFKQKILEALPSKYILYLLESEISRQTIISNDTEFKFFLQLVSQIYKLFNTYISKEDIETIISKHAEKIASDDYSIRLWVENIIRSNPSFKIVGSFFYKQDDTVKLRIYKKLTPTEKTELFRKFKNEQNFLATLQLLSKIINVEKEKYIQKELVSIIFESESYENSITETPVNIFNETIVIFKTLPDDISHFFIEAYYTFTPDYLKIKLWLYDFVQASDYNLYNANFIFLTIEEQKRLIKKYFYLLSKKIPGISLETILSLKNLTFTPAAEGKRYQLDFSCNIALSAIENMSEGVFLSEKKIFDLLTKHVENNTNSLLSLSGFFEPCVGRAIPDKTEILDDKSKRIVS